MKKWICVYLMLAFSVLGIGIYIRGGDEQIPANEVIVPGMVVNYEAKHSRSSKGGTSTTYAEVISFDLNGTTHRFTRSTSFGWKPKIGRVRQIVVNPARPSSARVRMWTWVEKLCPQAIKQYPVIIVLWIMGLAFFGVGFLGYMYQYEFFRRAIRLQGKVTSYETRRSSKGGTSYVEVISFDFDGQTRTVTSNVGMPFKPKMGTLREIGVDPQNPQCARAQGGGWFYLIFAGAGILLWTFTLFADKFH